jgi:hypothetical protein
VHACLRASVCARKNLSTYTIMHDCRQARIHANKNASKHAYTQQRIRLNSSTNEGSHANTHSRKHDCTLARLHRITLAKNIPPHKRARTEAR